MGKNTEAEKLQIKVLNARKRILGVEHPYTIQAMENLAAILQSLQKDKESFKLVIQAQNVKIKAELLEQHATMHVHPWPMSKKLRRLQ